MNTELWLLARNEKIEDLVEALVIGERLRLRRFDSVSELLNMDEPDGGLILVIDGTGSSINFQQIVTRFEKNFINFEVIVFDSGIDERHIEDNAVDGIDLLVPVTIDLEDFLLRAAHLVNVRRVKSSAGIVGRSAALREVIDTIIRAAPTEVSILIEGESGSGKELVAKAVHLRSNRRSKGFEAVNCGAMAEGVLESELFGHEKGSFTGAVSRRIGLFERADRGTLFLDEVGEMSLTMQVRFLRVLEIGEYMRVGGNEKLTTDVRIIAATNRELETSVAGGGFRKDLYYRLKVVQIRIPPLRARQPDIPFLARHFLIQSSSRHNRRVLSIDKAAMNLMRTYAWPGNVRELANVIDNIVVMSTGERITLSDIETRLVDSTTSQSFPDLPVHVEKTRDQMERELIINSLLSLHNDVREILRMVRDDGSQSGSKWRRWEEVVDASEDNRPGLDDIEKEAIREALLLNGGNRKKAARQLGLSERTLYRRLKGYGLS
ncbi:MAG: sigma-54 dependent transcriptional regulator [Bacteroidales bacterium]|nr:sigma-54 dependent transcriptional regulator [Candidatus Latescibacterota bacterium]